MKKVKYLTKIIEIGKAGFKSRSPWLPRPQSSAQTQSPRIAHFIIWHLHYSFVKTNKQTKTKNKTHNPAKKKVVFSLLALFRPPPPRAAIRSLIIITTGHLHGTLPSTRRFSHTSILNLPAFKTNQTPPFPPRPPACPQQPHSPLPSWNTLCVRVRFTQFDLHSPITLFSGWHVSGELCWRQVAVSSLGWLVVPCAPLRVSPVANTQHLIDWPYFLHRKSVLQPFQEAQDQRHCWCARASGIQDCLWFPMGASSYSKIETDPDFAQDAPETLPFPSASPVTPWYEPHSWRGPRTNWVSEMESQALVVLVQAWLMHTRP